MAAQDILFIGIILFVIGTGFFVINYVSNSVIDVVKVAPAINETPAAVQALEDTQTNINSKMDYLMFAIFIGLVFAALIISFIGAGSPLFMFFYFVILIIGIIISAILANSWETITGLSIFGATISRFPITNHLILYMPFYLTAVGLLSLFVTLLKPKE